LQNGEIVVNPVILNERRMKTLESNIMLFFSGISRFSSDIAKDQVQNININIENITLMKSLVDEAYDILVSDESLDKFGELLNYTWELKKKLSNNITNPTIESMYNTALKAGAIGGKGSVRNSVSVKIK
jgi:D-glycero-alpha-D-manno-heptose-7-phosphate kinase